MSNLFLQYRTSLSAVVTAITTHRITPKILPVSSLRQSCKIKSTLFENNILTAYSLGRIHHIIYSLTESIVFLVVSNSCSKNISALYTFYLPKKIAEKQWRMKSFPDDVRLIHFNNRWHTSPIGG